MFFEDYKCLSCQQLLSRSEVQLKPPTVKRECSHLKIVRQYSEMVPLSPMEHLRRIDTASQNTKIQTQPTQNHFCLPLISHPKQFQAKDRSLNSKSGTRGDAGTAYSEYLRAHIPLLTTAETSLNLVRLISNFFNKQNKT